MALTKKQLSNMLWIPEDNDPIWKQINRDRNFYISGRGPSLKKWNAYKDKGVAYLITTRPDTLRCFRKINMLVERYGDIYSLPKIGKNNKDILWISDMRKAKSKYNWDNRICIYADMMGFPKLFDITNRAAAAEQKLIQYIQLCKAKNYLSKQWGNYRFKLRSSLYGHDRSYLITPKMIEMLKAHPEIYNDLMEDKKAIATEAAEQKLMQYIKLRTGAKRLSTQWKEYSRTLRKVLRKKTRGILTPKMIVILKRHPEIYNNLMEDVSDRVIANIRKFISECKDTPKIPTGSPLYAKYTQYKLKLHKGELPEKGVLLLKKEVKLWGALTNTELKRVQERCFLICETFKNLQELVDKCRSNSVYNKDYQFLFYSGVRNNYRNASTRDYINKHLSEFYNVKNFISYTYSELKQMVESGKIKSKVEVPGKRNINSKKGKITKTA